MNFSAHADPEPELLLAILRQISLIENKQESRRMNAKFGQTMQKAMSHKMELHTKERRRFLKISIFMYLHETPVRFEPDNDHF